MADSRASSAMSASIIVKSPISRRSLLSYRLLSAWPIAPWAILGKPFQPTSPFLEWLLLLPANPFFHPLKGLPCASCLSCVRIGLELNTGCASKSLQSPVLSFKIRLCISFLSCCCCFFAALVVVVVVVFVVVVDFCWCCCCCCCCCCCILGRVHGWRFTSCFSIYCFPFWLVILISGNISF